MASFAFILLPTIARNTVYPPTAFDKRLTEIKHGQTPFFNVRQAG